MQIKIAKSETDAVKYICALNDFTCNFAPTTTQGIISVRITDRGKEISPSLAFILGRQVQLRIEIMESSYKIQEAEENYTGQNNVLTIVEDLP
jgi:hypothetical protein